MLACASVPRASGSVADAAEARCPDWAKAGECRANPSWMFNHCLQACASVGGTSQPSTRIELLLAQGQLHEKRQPSTALGVYKQALAVVTQYRVPARVARPVYLRCAGMEQKATGSYEGARRALSAGLQAYPSDPKLTAALAKVNQALSKGVAPSAAAAVPLDDDEAPPPQPVPRALLDLLGGAAAAGGQHAQAPIAGDFEVGPPQPAAGGAAKKTSTPTAALTASPDPARDWQEMVNPAVLAGGRINAAAAEAFASDRPVVIRDFLRDDVALALHRELYAASDRWKRRVSYVRFHSMQHHAVSPHDGDAYWGLETLAATHRALDGAPMKVRVLPLDHLQP